MDTWLRRTLLYIVALGGIILGYAFAYDYGMAVFENNPQPFLRSLRVVVETFTTTGYGSDAPWSTTEMRLLVIVMDSPASCSSSRVAGVAVPLFEEAMATKAPNTVDTTHDPIVTADFPR